MKNKILGLMKYPLEKRKSNKLITKHGYERLKFEDRDVLERIIFPYILAFCNPRVILDIGREAYQVFYNEFFKGRELWTLDINSERKNLALKTILLIQLLT